MPTLEQVRQVCHDNKHQLLSIRNVIGVGVGVKRVGGVLTGRLCTVVTVIQKMSLSALNPSDVIPADINGVPTDVVQSAIPRKRVLERGIVYQTRPNEITNRFRPCPAGPSVGHFRVTAGTCGLWVSSKAAPVDAVRRYLLSNSHVLANEDDGSGSNAKIGDAIYQPGPFDGGGPGDLIARLHALVPIPDPSLNVPILSDAAVAEVEDPAFVSESVLNLPKIGRLSRVVIPGTVVQKVGRTTSYQKGFVDQIDVSIRVQYSKGIILCEDQFVVKPGSFSAPGDSGSSVWTEQMEFIGLLFAGSDTQTIVCHHGHIMNRLGVYLRLPL